MSGRPSPTAARVTVAERSRLRRLRASHSYGLVLGLVLASFVFTLIAPDAAWTASALVFLQSVTLACALWTSGLATPRSPFITPLLLIGITAAVLNIFPGGKGPQSVALVFAGAITFAIAIVIGRGVVDQGEANVNSIRGAVAIYILLGQLFLYAYGLLALLGPDPFFANGTDGTRALRTYFSYVTLATLGYGDYTPASTFGHTLAVLEALLGQLYLVTVVAVLVSRLGHRRLRGDNGDGPSSSLGDV
jgi:Ion channel